MLPGFNTNIRHRGVLFHVQSEDSGRARPHVITHLYYGGTILASEKTGYADRLDAPDLPAVVRALMESQHKAVLKRLRAREFDPLITERLGASIFEDTGEGRVDTRPAELPAGGAEAEGAPPASASADASGGRTFGDGIVSERPLDEVILNYLVENARKRKQRRS